jgi:cytidylate kinase
MTCERDKGCARKALLVTIDGPAGAGKTTVSKLLAQKLGYRYLDTGALYRGVALAAESAGIAPDDDAALAGLCQRITLELVEAENGSRLVLDHVDISDLIRTPRMSLLASAVSARPVVRDFLLNTQRAIGSRKKVVVEGRDMGTVVFPEADVKFFLDADVHVRARRRFRELRTTDGQAPPLGVVEEEMARRDTNDATRPIAPLRPAPDAIRIDSSRLTIEDVVDLMLRHILRGGPSR